jgi:hypothetical protein
MSKQNIPLEERIKGIDNPEDITKLIFKEFLEGIDRLRTKAETNLELRNTLLTDPYPELKKHGIPIPPGTKLRFFEQALGEYPVPLAPYRGEITES